jgi:hypothetical protein
MLDSGNAQARPFVRQTLHHGKADPDLAGVRDPAALAKRPEDERAAWRALWAVVDGLLKDAAFPADPFRHGATGGAESGPFSDAT